MSYGDDGKVFLMYLAGPVDGVSKDESSSWREQVAEEFPNVVFFCPNTAYRNLDRRSVSAAEHISRHVIRCSDAVIANLTGVGRGFGTIREIEFARIHNVYVGLAAEPGDIGDSLMTYDLHVSEDPISAVQEATEFLAKKVNELPTIMGFPLQQYRPVDEDEA